MLVKITIIKELYNCMLIQICYGLENFTSDKWNIYKWDGIFINGIFPAISINKGCHSHQ